MLTAQQEKDNIIEEDKEADKNPLFGMLSKSKGKSGKLSAIKYQVQALARELGGIQIDVKVKMAKVCHKNVLTVRYFFIEVLENNHYFMNTQGRHPNNYQIESPLP